VFDGPCSGPRTEYRIERNDVNANRPAISRTLTQPPTTPESTSCKSSERVMIGPPSARSPATRPNVALSKRKLMIFMATSYGTLHANPSLFPRIRFSRINKVGSRFKVETPIGTQLYFSSFLLSSLASSSACSFFGSQTEPTSRSGNGFSPRR
jgi:hypothetical protein